MVDEVFTEETRIPEEVNALGACQATLVKLSRNCLQRRRQLGTEAAFGIEQTFCRISLSKQSEDAKASQRYRDSLVSLLRCLWKASPKGECERLSTA